MSGKKSINNINFYENMFVPWTNTDKLSSKYVKEYWPILLELTTISLKRYGDDLV